ncbi:MAG: tetratricopeptide repeat protein [Candidatus Riflebacteria bacterium]|nr:tetratricopeptide repeat protein [Candidatus Riflebacteria bacterium]
MFGLNRMWCRADSLFIKITVCIAILFFSPEIKASAQAKSEFARRKAEILIEKGLAARKSGKLELAVQAFQEASEVFPSNFSSLVQLAETYRQVGMHPQAYSVLQGIPISSLPPVGQSSVYLMSFEIQMAISTPESAAKALLEAVKVYPLNQSAVIRLEYLQRCFNLNLKKIDTDLAIYNLEILSLKDTFLGMLLELEKLNLLRSMDYAYSLSEKLEHSISVAEQSSEKQSSIFNFPLCLLIMYFPLAVSNGMMLAWLIFGSILLVLYLRRYVNKGTFAADVFFIAGSSLLMYSVKEFSVRNFCLAILQTDYYFADPIWITPLVLLSSNIIFIALFILVPLIQFLPPVLRTQRREIYSLWFFSTFLCLLISVFQSRMGIYSWLGWNFAAFFICIVSSCFVPIGRYFAFFLGSFFGRSIEIDEPGVEDRTGLGDAWMLEARAGKALEKEDFNRSIEIAKAVFVFQPKYNLPNLWRTYIRTLLEMENFSEAEREIKEYLIAFHHPPFQEEGQVLWALYKSLTGDHESAYTIVESISPAVANYFSPENRAVLMLVIARFFIFSRNPIQANIELRKANDFSTMSLNKIIIITELCSLECSLERPEKIAETGKMGNLIAGGPKTESYCKMIDSMVFELQGKREDALLAAENAVKLCATNSRAKYWLGFLFIRAGQKNKAEDLLETIPNESEESRKLLQDLTEKK